MKAGCPRHHRKAGKRKLNCFDVDQVSAWLETRAESQKAAEAKAEPPVDIAPFTPGKPGDKDMPDDLPEVLKCARLSALHAPR